MNDASEVLGVIFECLHKSYTSRADCHAKSHESNSIGSWDCASDFCIAHCLFGMDVYERMNCHSCGLESRRLKYTSFFHNINASSLRTAKVSCFPYVESHAYYSRVSLFSGWTGPVYAPQLFLKFNGEEFQVAYFRSSMCHNHIECPGGSRGIDWIDHVCLELFGEPLNRMKFFC